MEHNSELRCLYFLQSFMQPVVYVNLIVNIMSFNLQWKDKLSMLINMPIQILLLHMNLLVMMC